ncbi:MAG TPA: ABC transporter permease [Vicinamibacterales bacterium]|nr:ABC transporter permease [Vicinamibacterales bacterium]
MQNRSRRAPAAFAQAVAIAVKEMRQVLRDRRSLMILLFIPAFFLLLYGYALNFDIRNVSLAVQDRDRSTASRALVSAFVNSGYFSLVGYVDSPREIDRLVDENRVRAVLSIPDGFERDLAQRQPVTVQVIIDGDNANTAATVTGYARALIGEFGSAQLLAVSGPPSPVPGAVIAVEPRIWYNPQLRSTLFLVPGLIAYISMITAVVSTALSVVREKERGTMEQVRMAPLSPLPYIIGKTLPYLAISFVSAIMVILSAMALFDLPMRGSWLLLCAAIALFLIGAQAQGLLISTIADTQQVAFQVALLSSLLPTMILSGFIFPITSMPIVVQWITHIVPARYFLVALRSIVLKGAGVLAFWQDLAALAVFATVALGLASLRLRREWS